MNPFKIISRVKPIGLWNLLKITMPHLGFIWPTYKATKKCIQLSTENYGTKHYQNGQANAFRHALWNILIAKYCTASSSAIQRALQWAKKITDWHEETFFSKELPMKMDFHNNEVGRNLFKANPQNTQELFVEELLKLADNAFKISAQTELKQYKNHLVYITDDH